MECFKNVTDEQKVLLLKLFNDIGNKKKHDTLLAGLITVNNIVRRRPITNEKPNRSFACVYKVRMTVQTK